MRINFYLRGLGIGMVVASLIMGITNKPEELSDEQIKYRASLLGMIDEDDLLLSEIENFKRDEKRTISVSIPDLRIPQVSANSISGDSISNNSISNNEISQDALPSSDAAEVLPSGSAEKSSITDQVRMGNQSDEAEDGQAPENRQNKTDMDSGTKEAKAASSSVKAEKAASSSVKAEKAASSSVKAEKAASSSVKVEKAASSSVKAEKAASSSVKDDKEETDKTESSSVKENKEKTEREAVDPSDYEISREEKNQDGVHTETVTINVTSGMSSTDVAKLCQSAGLVKDYKEFDEFLCSNGYDRKLTTGKKSIPAGASQVEVAGILSVR